MYFPTINLRISGKHILQFHQCFNNGMIPALVIQNRTSPICSGEAAVPNYHQHNGLQKQYMKAERETGNILAVAAETRIPTFAPIMASRTRLSRNTLIPATIIANKVCAYSHYARSNPRTIPPLSISNLTGESAQSAGWIGYLGKPNLCNIGFDTN
jgi:hypothetical protein